MASDAATAPRARGAEYALLAGLTALALALRAYHPGALGIDHFDEGVYALSGLGLSDPSQPLTLFPDQVLFSPPVYFTFVAIAFKLAGAASAAAAVWVSILAGTFTVPALWGLLRRPFGAFAATAGATLLTFDDYHVSLCRTGLTDATFLLFFVLALWAVAAAVERGSFPRAVLAGLAVALAWNTKYHGWFAAMIGGVALLPWIVRGRQRGESWVRPALVLATVCVVAIVAYLPWARFIALDRPGGYGDLARYQRTMLEPRAYPANLLEQARNLAFLDGRTSLAGLLLALPLGALVAGAKLDALRRAVVLLAPAALLAALFGAPAARFCLAAVAVFLLMRRPAPLRGWMLLCCAGLFFFSAPLYHPYARLLLPLDLTLCALAGMALGAAATESTAARAPSRTAVAGLGAVVLAGFAMAFSRPVLSDPWRPADGAHRAAEEIAAIVPAGTRTVVLGEPTLAFELHLLGRPAFERVLHPDVQLAGTTEPLYVVSGRYGRKAPDLRNGLTALGARLVHVADVDLPMPRDHRLLDDLRIDRVPAYLAAPDPTEYRLTVYRLDPDTQHAPPREEER